MTWSPVKSRACSSTSQHRWSEAWPGVCSARSVRSPAVPGPGQRSDHPSPTHSSGTKPSAGPKPTTRAPVARARAAAPGAWSTWVWVTTMVRTDPSGATAATMASV